jgi:hypothetical protein
MKSHFLLNVLNNANSPPPPQINKNHVRVWKLVFNYARSSGTNPHIKCYRMSNVRSSEITLPFIFTFLRTWTNIYSVLARKIIIRWSLQGFVGVTTAVYFCDLRNDTMEWLAPPLHIQDVQGLNLGPRTGHHDMFFMVFSSPSKELLW